MHPLHNIVFPAASEKHHGLFLNSIGVWPQGLSQSDVVLQPGEGFRTDTYFGVFPLAQWKRLAALRSFWLNLDGAGTVLLRIRALTDDLETDALLFESNVELDCSLELTEFFSDCVDEGIYIEVIAITRALLLEISFSTADEPKRPVRLGLSITTFGRAEMVKETISKLSTFIESDPEPLIGGYTLTVVDNGRELDLNGFPNATVIPNANLGGAGGFARGLAHFAEKPETTHVCFMDDDAATEAECLLRARRVLAFANDERTAVSSAMLRAETSFMMHEQGALFEWGENHRIVSRKNGLDLLRRSDLTKALEPESFAYGGWWFFAFPIRGRLIYPYPMFVRGDDWLFSYLNDFNIETMVGIGSWQEGFEGKISPTEQYLATKAFLVAELILREPPNRLATARFFGKWIVRNVFGYCYDRASLNCEAISDVLKGPQFWADNVALGERLGEVRKLVTAEMLTPISAKGEDSLIRAARPERRLKTILRLLTLNGHLLPGNLLNIKREISIPRLDAPQPRFTFGRAQVNYVDWGQQKVFVAHKDTPRALALLLRATGLLLQLIVKHQKLRADYSEAIARFGTKTWWDDVFRKNA